MATRVRFGWPAGLLLALAAGRWTSAQAPISLTHVVSNFSPQSSSSSGGRQRASREHAVCVRTHSQRAVRGSARGKHRDGTALRARRSGFAGWHLPLHLGGRLWALLLCWSRQAPWSNWSRLLKIDSTRAHWPRPAARCTLAATLSQSVRLVWFCRPSTSSKAPSARHHTHTPILPPPPSLSTADPLGHGACDSTGFPSAPSRSNSHVCRVWPPPPAPSPTPSPPRRCTSCTCTSAKSPPACICVRARLFFLALNRRIASRSLSALSRDLASRFTVTNSTLLAIGASAVLSCASPPPNTLYPPPLPAWLRPCPCENTAACCAFHASSPRTAYVYLHTSLLSNAGNPPHKQQLARFLPCCPVLPPSRRRRSWHGYGNNHNRPKS